MTIMSEQQALKYVCRQIRKKGDAIGSIDRPFLDEIFAGRSPSNKEVHYLLGGIDQGIDRNQLFVAERDELGRLVTVDLFDCSKAEQAVEERKPEMVVRPTLTNVELLEILCEKLQNRRNDSGLIITGLTKPRLIEDFYDELSGEYDVAHEQIERVFAAMYNLGVRDDSAKLRKTGMQFDATELMQRLGCNHTDESSASEAALHEQITVLQERAQRLQTANDALTARVKLLSEENSGLLAENEVLTHENASLSEANERQSQAIADLRTRNAALAKFENTVRIAVEKYDENR